MTFCEEVVNGLQQTSIKGVPRLFNVKSVILKVVWSVAIVTFLATGFYQSVVMIIEYLSYPKLTIVTEALFSYEEDYVFPSIQVCNVNQEGLLRDTPSNETMEYYRNLVRNTTNCSDCIPEDKLLLEHIADQLQTYNGYIAYVGVGKAIKLQKNYSDFMIECLVHRVETSAGIRCADLGDVKVVIQYNHLSCLKISFPPDEKIEKVSMTFYLDNSGNDSDYVSGNKWRKQASGVAYSIFNSKVKDVSVLAQPTAPSGVLTSVNLHKEVYRRLSEPYGVCSMSKLGFSDRLLECAKRGLVEYCNCIMLADYDTEENEKENLTYCLSVKLSPSEILENFRCTENLDILQKCITSCKHHNCHEVRYTTDVSYTKWPLPNQYASFYHRLNKNKHFPNAPQTLEFQNNDSTADPSDLLQNHYNLLLKRQSVRDNFLRIDFSLSTEAYQEFVDVPEFSLFSFVGSLGGILNLWTGITVVVVVEFIEIIINVITSRKTDSKKEPVKK